MAKDYHMPLEKLDQIALAAAKAEDLASVLVSPEALLQRRRQAITASITARNCSRRVIFLFVASRRPGTAACFGVGRSPCSSPRIYKIMLEAAGFSEVPKVLNARHSESSFHTVIA